MILNVEIRIFGNNKATEILNLSGFIDFSLY